MHVHPAVVVVPPPRRGRRRRRRHTPRRRPAQCPNLATTLATIPPRPKPHPHAPAEPAPATGIGLGIPARSRGPGSRPSRRRLPRPRPARRFSTCRAKFYHRVARSPRGVLPHDRDPSTTPIRPGRDGDRLPTATQLPAHFVQLTPAKNLENRQQRKPSSWAKRPAASISCRPSPMSQPGELHEAAFGLSEDARPRRRRHRRRDEPATNASTTSPP